MSIFLNRLSSVSAKIIQIFHESFSAESLKKKKKANKSKRRSIKRRKITFTQQLIFPVLQNNDDKV